MTGEKMERLRADIALVLSSDVVAGGPGIHVADAAYDRAAVRVARALLGLLPAGEVGKDEEYGRTWAAQQGHAPDEYRPGCWRWNSCTSRRSVLPPAVEFVSGLRYTIHPTEAAAYAALGAAVRAVHAAVPPLASTAGGGT